MNILTAIASVSLVIAFISAAVIAVDEFRHPQRMWIMNIVWPVTALYLSVFTLWVYFRIGRGMAKDATHGMPTGQMQKHHEQQGRANPDLAPDSYS
jgi:hypothetical protein